MGGGPGVEAMTKHNAFLSKENARLRMMIKDLEIVRMVLENEILRLQAKLEEKTEE